MTKLEILFFGSIKKDLSNINNLAYIQVFLMGKNKKILNIRIQYKICQNPIFNLDHLNQKNNLKIKQYIFFQLHHKSNGHQMFQEFNMVKCILITSKKSKDGLWIKNFSLIFFRGVQMVVKLEVLILLIKNNCLKASLAPLHHIFRLTKVYLNFWFQ